MEEEIKSEKIEEEIPILNLDELESNRRTNPGKPWRYARLLNDKGAAEFLTIDDIYNKISTITNIRDRALMAILYLCGARVEEVVRYSPVKYGKTLMRVVKKGKAKNMLYPDIKKKKVYPMQPGMKLSDITIEEINGKKIVKFRIRNLKSRDKKRNHKFIPVPLDSPKDKEINIKFIKLVKQYTITLKPEEELFPITSRRAEQIINKALEFNPHFFRDLRLTHLVKYYNFSDQKLIAFAGWADSRPAKHYIKIGWKDLIDSM